MVTGLLMIIWASFALPHQILPPVDLRISETALGEVTVSWSEHPAQKLRAGDEIYYDVVLEAGPDRAAHPLLALPERQCLKNDSVSIGQCYLLKYKTKSKETRRTLALNGDLLATVCTILSKKTTAMDKNQCAEVRLPPHSGDPGTSGSNLSCVTYRDISDTLCLNCTWLAGQNAPRDTKYFLFYRYCTDVGECQQYFLDVEGKFRTSCHSAKPRIQVKRGNSVVIYINGSSDHATIQPYYQLYDSDLLERIQPPRNITALQKEEFLQIQWQCPRLSCPDFCYVYEVKITDLKMGMEQVTSSDVNEIQIFENRRSRLSVHVRATGQESCRLNNQWSEWSQPVFTGELQQDGLFIMAVALLLTLFVLFFISAMLCRRFHVCMQIFPPIPSPEATLKDVFLFPNNGKQHGSSSTQESEVISYIEELYSDDSRENEDYKAVLMLRK